MIVSLLSIVSLNQPLPVQVSKEEFYKVPPASIQTPAPAVEVAKEIQAKVPPKALLGDEPAVNVARELAAKIPKA